MAASVTASSSRSAIARRAPAGPTRARARCSSPSTIDAASLDPGFSVVDVSRQPVRVTESSPSLPTVRLDPCLTSLAFFTVEPAGPVAVCTLDKPPANTLDEELYAEIDRLVAGIELSSDVRSAVIASAHPSIFVAGADIKRMADYDFRPGATGRKVDLVHATFRRLERVGKPTVAAIAGHALGGGCELALACDFRVMAEGDARIGLPEVGLGIIPGGGGTQRLARLVGRGRAAELLMLGTRLSASDAERIGLVTRACPTPEDTLREAIALSERLARMPSPGLRLIKRCLNDGVDGDLDHGLAIEREAVVEALSQPEAREGIAAFVERRAPRFHP
jgi:enoyl-CoA hydratase/carnithine racemase